MIANGEASSGSRRPGRQPRANSGHSPSRGEQLGSTYANEIETWPRRKRRSHSRIVTHEEGRSWQRPASRAKRSTKRSEPDAHVLMPASLVETVGMGLANGTTGRAAEFGRAIDPAPQSARLAPAFEPPLRGGYSGASVTPSLALRPYSALIRTGCRRRSRSRRPRRPRRGAVEA
jgi:hypothetical protein